MLLNSNTRQKSSHAHPTLSLSGGTIPLVPSTTHLIVRRSCSLLWSERMSQAIQRVHFKVFTLKRLARHPGSCNLVKHLYLSLVRPALENMLRLCGTHAQGMTRSPWNTLSVARAVLRASRRNHHNADVLSKIGWPSLAWRWRRYKTLMLWDFLHGGGPPSLQDQVPSSVSSRSHYYFRNPLSLSFPACRTSHRLKSFLPSTIALFNSLPSSVVSCSSKSGFTRALDRHFSSDKFSFGLSWPSFFLSFSFFF